MAKNIPKSSVTMKAGQNQPVNNVIKFEDLVQKLKEGAPAGARKKGGGNQREQLTAIEQLAADLEKRLRQLRRAHPAPAAARPPRKPKA